MLISRANALGSVCALALVGGGAERLASAAGKADSGDVKTLLATLALERAAVKTYADFASAKALSPAVLAVFAQFLADHTAHRDALAQALSTAGSADNDVALPDTPAPQSEIDALETAYTLERALAQAHLGAVTTLHAHDYGTTAASILGVETTHVALLGEALRKGQAYPSGFVTQ